MDELPLACLVDAALECLDVSLEVLPLSVILPLHIAILAPASDRSGFVLTRNGSGEEMFWVPPGYLITA